MRIQNILLLAVASTISVGCTTYPKTYTYSPTVTINGDNSSTTPLVLPNPFAKTPRAKTEYTFNTTHQENSYRYQERRTPAIYNNSYPTYNHEETYVFVGPEYLEAN